MSECKPSTCGVCLPDYRYYVNREPALFNVEQSVEIPCPVGYSCQQPGIIETMDPGERKLIPDLPPNDPERNDNGLDLYLGGVRDNVNDELTRDGNRSLRPRLIVASAEQTATCRDLGYDVSGGATVTVPRGWRRVALLKPEDRFLIQREVDQLAKAEAIRQLKEQVELGAVSCDPLWTVSNAAFGPGQVRGTTRFNLVGRGGTITIQWVSYSVPSGPA